MIILWLFSAFSTTPHLSFSQPFLGLSHFVTLGQLGINISSVQTQQSSQDQLVLVGFVPDLRPRSETGPQDQQRTFVLDVLFTGDAERGVGQSDLEKKKKVLIHLQTKTLKKKKNRQNRKSAIFLGVKFTRTATRK